MFVRKKNRGFTLMELLIICALLGIMTTIVIAYLGGAKAKGRDARRIGDIKQIEQALEIYFSSHNTYPSTLSQLGPEHIMTSIPKDPLGSDYNYYFTDTPTLQYHVCATIELGYTGGVGKSGQAPIGPGDQCDGTAANIYDRYGP